MRNLQVYENECKEFVFPKKKKDINNSVFVWGGGLGLKEFVPRDPCPLNAGLLGVI